MGPGGYLQILGGGTGGGGGGAPSSGGELVDNTFLSAEAISGGRAVALTQSGTLQTAMAAVSGRMPAVGIVASNYLSGANVVMFVNGKVLSNPFWNFSGWTGQPVFVGASGDVVASGAPSASGNVQQLLGVSVNGSGLDLILGDPLEGVIAGSGDIGSGAVTGQAGGGSFCIGSGTVGRYDIASGNLVETWPCGQALSGCRAVTWGSGGDFVVPADRSSGLRLPAFGVSVSTAVSGATVEVVTLGRVFVSFSGGIASGFPGGYLHVGSGGLLINQSGFMGGASSGHGAGPTLALSGYSGSLVQRVGVWVSGGLYVNPEQVPSSGLQSGLLGCF